jgi:hypothetical protein
VTRRRSLRIALAVVLGVGLWFLVDIFGPAWIAALIALLLTASVSGVAERYAPTVVAAATGASPLGVVVGDDIGFYSDGWSVVLPGELLRERWPKENTPHVAARSHLVSVGAYDLGATHLRLALEGRSRRTVTVTEIRVRVHDREPPLVGTVVRSPSAGMQEVYALQFNLEEDEPVARGDDGAPVFRNYALTLAEGEVEVYAIKADASTSACAWELEIDFTVSGKKHPLPVRRAGAPFRTTAHADAYTQEFEWAWYERPARLINTSQSDSVSGPAQSARGQVDRSGARGS